MRRDNDRKVGWREARKLWRLGEGGTVSKVVRIKTKARAQVDVIEIVVKIADVP